MKRYIFTFCALALMALAFVITTGCGSSESTQATETITVEHKLGTTEVPLEPKRVVVLSFGALDTLDALGLGDRVVGLPSNLLPT